jgi:hypothetical protein
MAAAAQGSRRHLGAPFLEVGHGGVAEGFDFGAMGLEDAQAGFHFGAAGVVSAVSFCEGVLDHGVADDDANLGRDGREGVFERAAIDHDGVVLRAAAGDELVHDADIGTDEDVLRALAEQGDLLERHVVAGSTEHGESRSNFNGGRGAEAGAEGNIAGDGEGEAVLDGDAVLAESPQDAGGVVGPGFGAGGEKFVDGLVDALVEVNGVGEDAAVGAVGDGDDGGEVDGRGHDEAVRVVGVLADEVDAARGQKYRGVGAEPLRVFFLNTVYIQHAGLFSPEKIDRALRRYLSTVTIDARRGCASAKGRIHSWCGWS